MKRDGWIFTLNSGRQFRADRGILGINSDGEVYEGCDVHLTIYKDPFSDAERQEIAEYVINLWKKWSRGVECMAEEIVNYKKILIAYINYVRTVEGIDFIIDPVDTVAELDHPSSVRCGVNDFPDLTLGEIGELVRLAKCESIRRIEEALRDG